MTFLNTVGVKLNAVILVIFLVLGVILAFTLNANVDTLSEQTASRRLDDEIILTQGQFSEVVDDPVRVAQGFADLGLFVNAVESQNSVFIGTLVQSSLRPIRVDDFDILDPDGNPLYQLIPQEEVANADDANELARLAQEQRRIVTGIVSG